MGPLWPSSTPLGAISVRKGRTGRVTKMSSSRQRAGNIPTSPSLRQRAGCHHRDSGQVRSRQRAVSRPGRRAILFQLMCGGRAAVARETLLAIIGNLRLIRESPKPFKIRNWWLRRKWNFRQSRAINRRRHRPRRSSRSKSKTRVLDQTLRARVWLRGTCAVVARKWRAWETRRARNGKRYREAFEDECSLCPRSK